jgi:hypothetical protein
LKQFGDAPTRAGLAETATEQLANGFDKPTTKIWLPVLMQLDPEAGVTALETGLARAKPTARGSTVAWFSLLFDQDRRGAVSIQSPEFTPALLLRLARLAYRHVRPMDDVHREGAYSPDARDHAERARGILINAIFMATGPEGWKAKLDLAADPLFADLKDRAIVLARERAAEDAEGPAYNETDVLAIDVYGEIAPTTRDAMFAIMRDRLDDIENLLLRDVSPREAWANISNEHLMRRELARELTNHANHMYTVDQEGATADEKETDIRMRSTRSSQQATIELKIGEQPRSAGDLRDALKDQLLNKYMAAEECRSGCLVVTLRSNKSWRHPDNGKQLDFDNLLAMLNREASRLTSELGGTIRLMARGIDLRPRLKTEKETAKKSKRAAKKKPRTPKRAAKALKSSRKPKSKKKIRNSQKRHGQTPRSSARRLRTR